MIDKVTEKNDLVSIFMFCKNAELNIKRSLESILNQSYDNIEIIIQDSLSTDNTCNIIKSYKSNKIKLISEYDSGPNEGFWKAIKRCNGSIIASCQSDEELLKDSILDATKLFKNNIDPMLGAITRDVYHTDLNGNITSEVSGSNFDLIQYMSNKICPFFSSSFFSKKALDSIGLLDRDWNSECGEFELWCRLGIKYKIKYVPGIASKYAISNTQLSSKLYKNILKGRIKIINNLIRDENCFSLKRKIEQEEMIEKLVISTLESFDFFVRFYLRDDQKANELTQLINKHKYYLDMITNIKQSNSFLFKQFLHQLYNLQIKEAFYLISFFLFGKRDLM